MGAKHRCNRDGSPRARTPSNPLTLASVGRSRPALLASASLIAVAALWRPGRRLGRLQRGEPDRLVPLHSGPDLRQGRQYYGRRRREVAGGPTGVYAKNCGIGALTNRGGIDGAAGVSGGAGGIGVKANSGRTIDLLTNANGGTISGGAGGSATTRRRRGRRGRVERRDDQDAHQQRHDQRRKRRRRATSGARRRGRRGRVERRARSRR